MHFASPYYLWLLTALVPMAGYYVWRTLQGGAAIQISSVDGVVRAPKTIRYYLRHLPFVLRAAAFALLVVALARPQDVERLSRTNTEGIDIMLAIDVSGSMLARTSAPTASRRPRRWPDRSSRTVTATASDWWPSRAKPSRKAR
ncbi:MAG: BatA domain-containing protein [Alistipes sp.]